MQLTGRPPQTRDGAHLTLEEAPKRAQSKCWPAEQELSPRCPSVFTDPEVPFSWSKEDISHLYGHTTILLAAEGEGTSASPHVVLGGWSLGGPTTLLLLPF